ncbi:MAG: LLM class F420-dependent oxidoreductase [Ilumatobacteraceae bacterium]
MELGLHIANFTWTGGAPSLGPDLARLATTAEDAGFANLTVMDHLWQIGPVGPVDTDMLEAYTTLGFLAAHTTRVQLHTLVTGVVYREPGLLAKAVTTLDVLSGGRAALGIGAAWNEEESLGLGLPFPSTAERFERLEEAVQIVLQMWGPDDTPYDGKHYHLARTLSVPSNLSTPHPKLMIGGGGERKTLRLVAKYADACNLFGGPDAAHKLDVLRAHCETEGRDYDTVTKTTTMAADLSNGPSALVDQLRGFHELGFTIAHLVAPGPTPLEAVETIGAAVIPEIATW